MKTTEDNGIDYKVKMSFEDRLKESQGIREKHPTRLPIIVQRDAKGDLEPFTKKKFLVPADLSAGQFFYIIRKKNQLKDTEALFFYVNGYLLQPSKIIGEIYEKDKDADGYLYIYVAKEKVFG